MASRAPARRSCTSRCCGLSWRWERGRFSSSPRSRSPPRPSRGCAACSAIRSPCSTRGSRMGSAPTPGVLYGAASAWWRWGRGRRCSRRCSGSPPSWSTRSTTRATSRGRRRVTTPPMRRSPAPGATACRLCGKETQRMRGLGTQQLEHFVGLRFPEARIARMDLDTTSTKWAHHRILERMAEGKLDILLGTQMIAKGLDFPNVTVVGVVDADTGLNLPDFRAAERTFQLVAQVAGRAGRGPKGGRVLVQTRAPDHHAIRAAAAHSVAGFAAAELPLRAPPNPAYPPHVGLARFVAVHEDERLAVQAAERVAAWLRRANTEQLGGALTVLGPAPCPIMRLKGQWRWHVLIKSPEARPIGRVVRAWGRGRGPGARGAVVADRDPVSLL